METISGRCDQRLGSVNGLGQDSYCELGSSIILCSDGCLTFAPSKITSGKIVQTSKFNEILSYVGKKAGTSGWGSSSPCAAGLLCQN